MNRRIVARCLLLLVLGLQVATAFGGGQGEDYGATLRQIETTIDEKRYNEASGELQRILREAPDYTDRALVLIQRVLKRKTEINDLKNELKDVFQQIDEVINRVGDYEAISDSDQEALVTQLSDDAFALILEIGQKDPYASPEDQAALDRASGDIANQQLRREAVSYYNQAESLIVDALNADPTDTETSVGKLMEALDVYLEMLDVFAQSFNETDFPEYYAQGAELRNQERVLVESVAGLQPAISDVLGFYGGLDRVTDAEALAGARQDLFDNRLALRTLTQTGDALAQSVIDLESRIVSTRATLFSVPYLRLAIITPILGDGIEGREENDGIDGIIQIMRDRPYTFGIERVSEILASAADAAVAGPDTVAADEATRFSVELATLLGEGTLASSGWDDGFVLADLPETGTDAYVVADTGYRVAGQVQNISEAMGTLSALSEEVAAYVPADDEDQSGLGQLRQRLEENRLTLNGIATQVDTVAQRLATTFPEGYDREKGWYSSLEALAADRRNASLEAEGDVLVASASYRLGQLGDAYAVVIPVTDTVAGYLAGNGTDAERNGRRPDLALRESQAALDQLERTQEQVAGSLETWRAEDGVLASRLEPSVTQGETLSANIEDTVATLLDQRDQANQLVQAANASATEAEGLVGIADGTLSRLSANIDTRLSQYETIDARLLEAEASYRDALTRWDNDEWWNAVQTLAARRSALADDRKGVVLQAIDGLLSRGQDQFDAFNYRNALDLFEQAKALLDDALPGLERSDIVNKISLTKKAIESEKDTKIAKTDPNYSLLVGYLVSAKQNITDAKKAGTDRDALLSQAKTSVDAVLDIKPYNIDARILDMEITSILDPATFDLRFQQLYNQAQQQIGNNDPAAYSILKTLNQFDPGNRDVASQLLQLEYTLGLRERPLSQAVINQSNAIRVEVAAEFNNLVASGNRDLIDRRVPALIERINEALALNPNNQAAKTLFNQMLNVGAVGKPTLSPADQAQYDLAVEAVQRGALGEARFYIRQLLAKGQNEANTRLLQAFLDKLQ